MSSLGFCCPSSPAAVGPAAGLFVADPSLTTAFFLLLSCSSLRGWRDVLIEPKEIRRIVAALDRNESLEGVGGRVTRVRSDEAHHAQEVSKRHAVRERGLDVEPERQAEVLPANVVGQVEQELLPGARTRETVGQFPGLKGYLLELGIYVPERLAGQVNHGMFLSLRRLDDRDTGRESSTRNRPFTVALPQETSESHPQFSI